MLRHHIYLDIWDNIRDKHLFIKTSSISGTSVELQAGDPIVIEQHGTEHPGIIKLFYPNIDKTNILLIYLNFLNSKYLNVVIDTDLIEWKGKSYMCVY